MVRSDGFYCDDFRHEFERRPLWQLSEEASSPITASISPHATRPVTCTAMGQRSGPASSSRLPPPTISRGFIWRFLHSWQHYGVVLHGERQSSPLGIDHANGAWYGQAIRNGTPTSTPTATNGQTYLVVIEIQFGSTAGQDSAYAWINPTPGTTAPSTGSAFDYQTGIDAGSVNNTTNAQL